ncbi:MAG: TolC family protein [Kofleriaceae bacterium]
MLPVSVARLTAVALCVVSSSPVHAGELDLAGAVARARQLAPDAVAARGKLAIAEAGARGAAVTFVDNPELEGGGGPRLTSARPIDFEVRIEQNLEPWRRSPRRALARASVAQTRAELDAALRELDLEVATAFYDALHAERTSELAHHTEELAARASEVAARRRKAGDITDLDLGLARGALGRARSTTLASTATRAQAIGRLAALIGAPTSEPITLRGELKPPPIDPNVLRGSPATLRVIEAERAVATAERDQAIANGRLQLALWAGYRREDADSIVAAGLRFTLPVWNRAQGERAAATARQHRATALHEVAIRGADRRLADASAAYAAARAALEAFEREVVPVLDDTELLLQKTMDAGQLAVSAYLLARQELLEGRREHLERLVSYAKADAAVRFAAGGAP